MYSHRNGENDAPTEAGRPSRFWFRGIGKYVMHDWQSEPYEIKGQVDVSKLDDGNLLAFCWIGDRSYSFDIKDMQGEWWGPIVEVPPWEQHAPAAND